MTHHILCALLLFALLNFSINGQQLEYYNAPRLSAKISDFLHSESGPSDDSQLFEGKKWALLVAGSLGYGNYRHQADVCHAYQILKKGGLKDENIIVFMYDDIAFHKENPRPGVIINSPTGGNVYQGVPKDYTGNDTSIHNLFAVILGNKSALTGGSGKVLDSGPKDHIFIYYSDHGAPGLISMPSDEYIYADDLIKVLKKKHESNSYASMVFYLEACESGSMFDGLLPENLNIYATTASNPTENSFATYCSDWDPFIPSEFNTNDTVCLGDTYSVAWMEDSERHDLRSETLEQQFQVVKRRTAIEKNMDEEEGSHVMHYGSRVLSKEFLYSYMGTSHSNDNYTLSRNGVAPYRIKSISQRDADLFYYWQKVNRAPEGSARMVEARKQLKDEIDSRTLVDDNIKQISNILSGDKIGADDAMLLSVGPSGQPLVEDWTCLKSMVKTYEKYCGSLSRHGMKYTRVFANMCNAGITVEQMIMASARSCSSK